MTDIAISYKREDVSRVAPLVTALEGSGFDVWWDQKIPGAAYWRQEIETHLAGAKCVIVVWSRTSVSATGDFVHDEAGRAKERGVLLPVRIDRVTPPVGFGEIQALDLVGWRGSTRDARFEDVRAAAQARIEGGPLPKPKAPGKRLRRALSASSIAALSVAATAFAVDLAGVQKAGCRIPGVHSACAAYGLGGVPTTAEEAVWNSRVPGDCSVLRTYLERFPQGAFSAEAGNRLQAARTEETELWRPGERRLPLPVRPAFEPFGSEDAARADALARAGEEAGQACSGYGTGEFRLRSAEAKPTSWRCSRRLGGVGCGFDGQAICHVDVREISRREVCR